MPSEERCHSGLSTILLCSGLFGFVLILIAPYLVPTYAVNGAISQGVRIFLVLLMAALTVAMYLTIQVKRYRIYLCAFVFASVLHTLIYAGHLFAFGLLLIIAIANIILYEPYPTNLVFCLMTVPALVGSFAVALLHATRDPWAVVFASTAVAAVGAGLSYFGAVVGKLRNELTDRQAAAERLARNITKLAQANVSSLGFAASAEEESRAEERRRLAREIHDLVGYTLTTNITLMEAVKLMAASEPERIPEYVETIRRNSENALKEIRTVLRELHSREERLELLALLVKLRKVYSYSTGVNVQYEFGNVDFTPVEPYWDPLYHFVREGLINAFQHGRATSVTVFFWRSETGMLEVTVEDNGIGASSFEEDIGIRGMRERAARIGGSVSIPRVSSGFKIRLAVPTNGDTRAAHAQGS
jgi:signal transduction histidine kinase